MNKSVRRSGRIVTRTGERLDVPDFLLDDEEIFWPPTLQEIAPGEGVPHFSLDDFYRRHEIVEGTAYLFLPAESKLEDVAPEAVAELLSSHASDRREFMLDGVRCRVWRDGTAAVSLTGALKWPRPAGIYFSRKGQTRFLAREIMEGPSSDELRVISEGELRALWEAASEGWPKLG